MKRALSILMLCSLLLLITLGIAKAADPDTEYQIIEYTGGITMAIVDGEWTDDEEWMDACWVEVNDDFDFLYYAEITAFSCEFCVELFSDDTDDAEDYWEFCFDDSNTGGDAPDVGDYRVFIEGHTTMTVYEGNGQGWDEITQQEGEITWADSIGSSPLESEDHWILEFTFLKTSGNAMIPNAPPTGLRVAAYDASNSDAGVQSWAPDSDVDVPDEWGMIGGFDMNPIPEGLTFAVMIFLSSVSLLVGSQYLRKRSKKR